MSHEACHNEHQHHHHQTEESCNMPERLLELADEAWMEVVKEKIKKEIEASCGDKLNNLAKLVAETNKAKWQAKLAAKAGCHEYKEKLFQFFTENHL